MPTKPVSTRRKSSEGVEKSLKSGRLVTLEAVLLVLARQLDEAMCCAVCARAVSEPPAAKAVLAKELRAVLAEIAALAPPEKVIDSVDEITERRERRVAAAHVAGSSVRRVRQRRG